MYNTSESQNQMSGIFLLWIELNKSKRKLITQVENKDDTKCMKILMGSLSMSNQPFNGREAQVTKGNITLHIPKAPLKECMIIQLLDQRPCQQNLRYRKKGDSRTKRIKRTHSSKESPIVYTSIATLPLVCWHFCQNVSSETRTWENLFEYVFVILVLIFLMEF